MDFDWARAAGVIRERGWIKGGLENSDGVCLTGALQYCQPVPGDWLIARAVARHRGHGENWNDETGRTRSQVLAWLEAAEPITDAELGAVFGPQWEAVVALVRRAAILTPDEGEALRAARDAARDAGRVAAWVAARDAAWDAAWNAARDAALDAAGDAAGALVVRDVLAPEHYATLTRPWVSVIGPVHPDDRSEQ
jgi:hypothetical protein